MSKATQADKRDLAAIKEGFAALARLHSRMTKRATAEPNSVETMMLPLINLQLAKIDMADERTMWKLYTLIESVATTP